MFLNTFTDDNSSIQSTGNDLSRKQHHEIPLQDGFNLTTVVVTICYSFHAINRRKLHWPRIKSKSRY